MRPEYYDAPLDVFRKGTVDLEPYASTTTAAATGATTGADVNEEEEASVWVEVNHVLK